MTDRKGVERRKTDEPMHVSVERLSQALEGRVVRLETSLERVEAALAQAVEVGMRLLRWVVGLVGLLIVGAFGVGGWIVFQTRDIEANRTADVVMRRALGDAVNELTKTDREILQELEVNSQEHAEIRQGLATLEAEKNAIRRDFEREHGGRP